MSISLVVGVVLFVVGIVASVALHEVGHLVPAKIFKVHVSQYMVGFGRTLVSRRRGETEYGLKALPLGGFVRLTGMYPPARRPARGPFAGLIESARTQALADVPPEAHGREFYTRRPWQKLIVMAGGPAMNFVLAFLLIGLGIGVIGEAQATTGPPVLSAVVACVPATVSADCAAGDPTSPAAHAGLEAGDAITAVGTSKVGSWEQAQQALKSGPRDTTITFVRAGVTHTRKVHLATIDEGDGTRANFLGVSPVVGFTTHHEGLSTISSTWWTAITQTTKAVVTLPRGIVTAVEQAAGSKARSTTGPSSVVGAGRISGQIAGADAPLSQRLSAFALLLASVNVALAVFNLLPLLPLDGGHIVGALWEWLRRAVARLRRLPDPGFVDVAKAVPLAYAVGLLILVSSALLIYADVVDPQHFS